MDSKKFFFPGSFGKVESWPAPEKQVAESHICLQTWYTKQS